MADITDVKGWTIDEVTYMKDQFHDEEIMIVKLKKKEEPKWIAKWLRKNNGIIWWNECSNCGKKLFISSPGKYCSDCGCEMTLDSPEPEEDEFDD